jgi:antitoxin ParD1/3/4
VPVILDPQQEALVRQKVESGMYQDASEVIREALRLLEEHDRRRWLQQALAEGERGDAIELTPERMDQIMQRAMDNLRAGKPIKDGVKP